MKKSRKNAFFFLVLPNSVFGFTNRKILLKFGIFIEQKYRKGMIDLDRIDPDWQFAVMHGEASKTGIRPEAKDQQKTLVCRCCLNTVYKDRAPLCENSKQLQFLGFGFPLYYVFLKNCILLLLLMICTYNSISLFRAFQNNQELCHGHGHHRRALSSEISCTTFMVEMARTEPDVSFEQQIIRILSFFIHLCFLIYMRDKIMKLEAYYDERTTSITDYCVIMKNIPPQKNIQKKIKQFFQDAFEEPHTLKQITLIPQYEEIKTLRERKMELIEQIRPFYAKQLLESEEYLDIHRGIKIVNEQIRNQAEKMNDLAQEDEMECEKVVLAFDTDEEKSKVIQEFQTIDMDTKKTFFSDKAVDMKLKEAPEPKQILWDNINVPKQKRIMYKIAGWLLSILVLLIVAVIFYFVMEQKALNLTEALEHLEQDPHNQEYQNWVNEAIALVYVMLILIVLFNKLLMVVLFHKFTDLQRNDTSSKFQFSFGLKYCLGLFFTTALMTLAVEAIRFNNYFSHLYGVVEEESVMFFLNALFVPLFWIVNPFQIIRVIKRNCFHGRRDLTQREANLLMQNSEYQIGKRYAEIIETMWFTFFYSTIVPIGAFASLFGLIIYYWIDKWTLLRRSTLSVEVQGKLVKFTMKMLDITLLLRPVGEIIFDSQIRDQQTVGSIVMIIIGFLYLIIPIDSIIECTNPEKFNLEEKTFEQAKHKFKDTYKSLHPIYVISNETKVAQKLLKAGLQVTRKIHSQETRMNPEDTLEIHLDVNRTQEEML